MTFSQSCYFWEVEAKTKIGFNVSGGPVTLVTYSNDLLGRPISCPDSWMSEEVECSSSPVSRPCFRPNCDNLREMFLQRGKRIFSPFSIKLKLVVFLMSTPPDVSFVSGIGVQRLPRDSWKEAGSPEVWTPCSVP